jgi:hypothetical protein
MLSQNTKNIVSFVLEDFLLQKVETFRSRRVRRCGHLSRSGAIRLLLVRGLEAFCEDQRRAAP